MSKAHAVRIWLSDVRTLRQSKRPYGQNGTWNGPVLCFGPASPLQVRLQASAGVAHQRVRRGGRVVELRENQRANRPRWRIGRHGARVRNIQIVHVSMCFAGSSRDCFSVGHPRLRPYSLSCSRPLACTAVPLTACTAYTVTLVVNRGSCSVDDSV